MRTALALVLSGCAQTIKLDEALPARSIVEACDAHTREQVTLDVSFPEREPSCDWGADGNLEPEQARLTARTEDVVALDMPESVAICDVTFDFADPDSEQILRYDDNFLFTLDDVVLAASYAPMVDVLEADGHLRLYDWDRLVGTPFVLDDPRTYCLGETEGLATCTIPAPETSGVISLDYGAEIVNELADYAFAEQRYEFAFVTVGDNDAEEDCSHAAFGFTVDVAYVPYVAYGGG